MFELIVDIFIFLVEIIIFMVLMIVGHAIHKNLIKGSSIRLLNMEEYLPKEEIHSLRQVFYLIMMGLLFADVLYSLVFWNHDIFYLAIFDIFLSLYVASTMDKSSLKNKILLILLVPFGSLTYIVIGNSLVGIVDFIHVPILIYFIKVYYDKFREYTRSNGLGIAVILLFTIIFISFLCTQLSEGVNPLDSLVMVSNAFTSNGYAVLGKTISGKINSIILVWGGYVLSGVGTATLTAAILKTHFNSKLEESDRKLEEYNKKLDNLEVLIKNINEK